jgi:hypothetical protein
MDSHRNVVQVEVAVIESGNTGHESDVAEGEIDHEEKDHHDEDMGSNQDHEEGMEEVIGHHKEIDFCCDRKNEDVD